MGSIHILQKNIERSLIDLLNEAEEAKKDITRVESKVTSLLGYGEENVRACTEITAEVDLKRKFKVVSQELNEIDEKLTLMRATIDTHSSYAPTEGVDKSPQSRGKDNYLMKKLNRKFESVEKEGGMIKETLNEYKYRIEDLVESAKTSAKIIWTCGGDNLIQIFKEVKSELGELDLRLTMLRSVITTCLELLIANEGEENTELRDGLEMHVIESTDDNINLECMTASAEQVDESRNSELVPSSRSIVDTEVEKVLSLKMEENIKLRSICNKSGKHRKMVKERLMESMLVSVCGDDNSQHNITR